MGAELSCANLKPASLFPGDRERAVLRDTNLVETELRHANFKDIQLMGSDFSGCRVKGACFTNPQGLTCQHKPWLRATGALNIPT